MPTANCYMYKRGAVIYYTTFFPFVAQFWKTLCHFFSLANLSLHVACSNKVVGSSIYPHYSQLRINANSMDRGWMLLFLALYLF